MIRFLAVSVFVATALLSSLVPAQGYTQNGKTDTASWRTSFAAFITAVDKVPLSEIPLSSSEGIAGRRVSSGAAIMKRFGGEVEWEGLFQGIVTEELPSRAKREKIDISMDRPSGLKGNTVWEFHLYPKAGSLRAWKRLAPKTPVKFRAVVTGITEFPTWLDVHVHGVSILLEEVEILSK